MQINKVHDLLQELKCNSPDFCLMLGKLIPGAFIVFLAVEDMERYEIACCLAIKLEYKQGG